MYAKIESILEKIDESTKLSSNSKMLKSIEYNSDVADHTNEFYIFYTRTTRSIRWVYFGQLRDPDSKIMQGYGIEICETGAVHQGY